MHGDMQRLTYGYLYNVFPQIVASVKFILSGALGIIWVGEAIHVKRKLFVW